MVHIQFGELMVGQYFLRTFETGVWVKSKQARQLAPITTKSAAQESNCFTMAGNQDSYVFYETLVQYVSLEQLEEIEIGYRTAHRKRRRKSK